MSEQKDREAGAMLDTVCRMFDGISWRYEKDEGNDTVRCTVEGQDLNMPVLFRVLSDRKLVVLHSPLPLSVPRERVGEMAAAVGGINQSLVDGFFYLDLVKNEVYFRAAASYEGARLSEEACFYLLRSSLETVERYNDKLAALADGRVDSAAFLNELWR